VAVTEVAHPQPVRRRAARIPAAACRAEGAGALAAEAAPLKQAVREAAVVDPAAETAGPQAAHAAIEGRGIEVRDSALQEQQQASQAPSRREQDFVLSFDAFSA
jgi:hypothetical protein